METLVLHNHPLTLLPEKAVYLPQHAALLVSDVHLGKSETFQHFGIPIPSQVNQATLQRLQQAQARTQAQRLFILGDLFHARAGMVDEVIDGWLKFLAATQLEAHLILGNHDRGLADDLSQFSLTCYTTPDRPRRHHPEPRTPAGERRDARLEYLWSCPSLRAVGGQGRSPAAPLLLLGSSAQSVNLTGVWRFHRGLHRDNGPGDSSLRDRG